MIIESQTVKSKSELQMTLQKMKMSKAVIYNQVKREALKELFASLKTTKLTTIIIIEN
jgi:hypothetical protein